MIAHQNLSCKGKLQLKAKYFATAVLQTHLPGSAASMSSRHCFHPLPTLSELATDLRQKTQAHKTSHLIDGHDMAQCMTRKKIVAKASEGQQYPMPLG